MRMFNRRSSNGTNTTEPGAILQSGWAVITNSATTQLVSTVTFSPAYATAPIVTVGCAGDAATNGGYGFGGVNLSQSIIPRINGLSTGGFTISISKADGTNFSASGFTWVTWIAIGQ